MFFCSLGIIDCEDVMLFGYSILLFFVLFEKVIDLVMFLVELWLVDKFMGCIVGGLLEVMLDIF